MTILSDDKMASDYSFDGLGSTNSSPRSTMSLSPFPPRPPLGRVPIDASTPEYGHHYAQGRSPHAYSSLGSRVSDDSLIPYAALRSTSSADRTHQSFEQYPERHQPLLWSTAGFQRSSKLVRILALFGTISLVYLVHGHFFRPHHGHFHHPPFIPHGERPLGRPNRPLGSPFAGEPFEEPPPLPPLSPPFAGQDDIDVPLTEPIEEGSTPTNVQVGDPDLEPSDDEAELAPLDDEAELVPLDDEAELGPSDDEAELESEPELESDSEFEPESPLLPEPETRPHEPAAIDASRLPFLRDPSVYDFKPRSLPTSWPDPWSHMPDDWPGRKYLAESRFAGGKGLHPLPEQNLPPARYLAKAYEYTAAVGRQANQQWSLIKYDEHTGRPLQVPRSAMKLSHEGWVGPELRVSELDKAKAFNRAAKKPHVQWKGKVDMSPKRVREEAQRREWVKRAFLHGWEGYKKYAWGHDEITPTSKSFADKYNGWGATIVDNLDTLLVMGLNEEYNLAREHVSALDFSYLAPRGGFSTRLPKIEHLELPTAENPRGAPPGVFSLPSPTTIPYFETVIRFLGGLISAYDLSGDPLMLERAIELGNWLLPSLNTDWGFPVTAYMIGANPHGASAGRGSLAEFGTLAIEFTRLSMISGDEAYFQAVQRSIDTFDTRFPRGDEGAHGRLGQLLPAWLDANAPTSLYGEYSFGGCADSYYEYLIKMAHLLGDLSGQYARMYTDAIDSAHEHLIRTVDVVPGRPGLVNIGSYHGAYQAELQHLTCFAGGMLGLGAKLLGRDKDMETGLNYTDTCHWAYESTASGLGPERLTFYQAHDVNRYHIVNRPDGTKAKEPRGTPYGVRFSTPSYIGRPETLESIFYMWRLTGDRAWQDKGWKMFVSWMEHSITEAGFAGVRNVNQPQTTHDDAQESFVLAETLKYYYLLFSDREVLSLDEYVFNTEAHPMIIPRPESKEPKKMWTGPSEPKQQDFASRIGEGTRVQQWSRVGQAAAFSHTVPVTTS